MKLNRRQLRRLIESVISEGFDPNTDDFSHSLYTVKKGDNLTKIAKNHCIPGCTAEHLAKLNGKLKDPNKLRPGQELKIYVPKEKEGTDSPPTPPMKK